MPKNNTAAPIMTNENVTELLKILRDNNAPTMRDFMAMLNQVAAMEKQYAAMTNELAAMRRDLAEAQKHNHPVKDTLQKAVTALQAQALELRDKLAALKDNIITGCKNAIEAFKDKGVAALDGIARFFHIKPLLEGIRNNAAANIAADDRAIAKIEAISTEYHETGKHLKNIGRAMIGKDTVQDAKPVGKLAHAFEAPYKLNRKINVSMKKSVESAIGAMARLEAKAAERKPSIKKTIEENNKKVEREKAERPPPVRARKVEHDI